MACRIHLAKFAAMTQEEAKALDLRAATVDSRTGDDGTFNMASVEGTVAVLHRKAIQSLVDEAEEARPLIRNLLRWAKEHGAR